MDRGQGPAHGGATEAAAASKANLRGSNVPFQIRVYVLATRTDSGFDAHSRTRQADSGLGYRVSFLAVSFRAFLERSFSVRLWPWFFLGRGGCFASRIPG